MTVHNAIQNHIAAVTTQAAVGAVVTMHYFHLSDLPVYFSAFVGLAGLILQAVYVWYVIKSKKD